MKNGEYTIVIASDSYPGKRYRGRYCYEHHLVWWENTGEMIVFGEVIHHKDGNKRNNKFCNLKKETTSSHAKHHGLERESQEDVVCVCPMCGSVFKISGRNYKSRRKNYGELWKPCCSRKCQVKKQRL